MFYVLCSMFCVLCTQRVSSMLYALCPVSACPYVVAPHHGQVEGEQLQGDDAEDALQAVHRVGQLDRPVGVLHGVLVVPATQDDGAPLHGGGEERQTPPSPQHRGGGPLRDGAPPTF